MGLSPAEVLAGYEKASAKALEMLPDLVCSTVNNHMDEAEMAKVLRPCLMSKQLGNEDFLSELVSKVTIVHFPLPSSTTCLSPISGHYGV